MRHFYAYPKSTYYPIVNIILSSTSNPSDESIYASDINQDGAIDILDIVELVNIVLNP